MSFHYSDGPYSHDSDLGTPRQKPKVRIWLGPENVRKTWQINKTQKILKIGKCLSKPVQIYQMIKPDQIWSNSSEVAVSWSTIKLIMSWWVWPDLTDLFSKWADSARFEVKLRRLVEYSGRQNSCFNGWNKGRWKCNNKI